LQRSSQALLDGTSSQPGAERRDTADFETPTRRSAFSSSSTFRVATPCTYASRTTAKSACSARLPVRAPGQIHSGLRHRVNASVFLLPPERPHGKMRDGGSRCLRRRIYRTSTTSPGTL